MVFNYTIQVGPETYSEELDETFSDYTDFEYEVDDDDVEDELANILYDGYLKKLKLDKDQAKLIKKEIKQFVSDYDLFDVLSEEYYDELKDNFTSEAMETYFD